MTDSRSATIPALVLIAALVLVGIAGCERPAPAQATPTAVLIITPQAPPPTTSSQAVPTVVSVLEAPATGSPTPTIVWNLPTFTPTTQLVSAATPTTQVTAPTPVPTATSAPQSTGSGTISYTVQWGDTLYGLARRYGTTVDAIADANGLTNENFIRVGQVLQIPTGSSGSAGVPSSSGETVYVVVAGDTLYGIASRFGTTATAIAQANGIMNPAFISVGERLVIPTGGSSTSSSSEGGTVYVVQPGDTLTSIAARFGTSSWAIAVANNLPNQNYIRAGQTLIIPGS